MNRIEEMREEFANIKQAALFSQNTPETKMRFKNRLDTLLHKYDLQDVMYTIERNGSRLVVEGVRPIDQLILNSLDGE